LSRSCIYRRGLKFFLCLFLFYSRFVSKQAMYTVKLSCYQYIKITLFSAVICANLFFFPRRLLELFRCHI
jgi:hypothetical protein